MRLRFFSRMKSSRCSPRTSARRARPAEILIESRSPPTLLGTKEVRVSRSLHKCSRGAAEREKVQSDLRPYYFFFCRFSRRAASGRCASCAFGIRLTQTAPGLVSRNASFPTRARRGLIAMGAKGEALRGPSSHHSKHANSSTAGARAESTAPCLSAVVIVLRCNRVGKCVDSPR